MKAQYTRSFLSVMKDIDAECCIEVTCKTSLAAGVLRPQDSHFAVTASLRSLMNACSCDKNYELKMK